MSSQDSVHEILERIAQWPSKEITEKLDDFIPVLVRSVQQCESDTPLQLKCLRAMLVTSLPCVAIDRADSLLLQHAVPAAKQLFFQVMNNVTVTLQGDVHIVIGDAVVKHIQVCQDVLDCLCSCARYVTSLCSVDCVLVQSIPGNVSVVLTQAFKHCRQSESLYGSMFEEMHDVLTVLFQKCCQLQTHFLAAMTNVIKFNCFFEDELVLLTEVLESISEVGQLAAALDVKAMVDTWKGYIQVAETYCEHLKPRLDVAKPLVSLAQQVVTSLETTVCLDSGEEKLITRNVKVISFQLKVILKLCEQYADYLGDCHQQLVLLLVSLYRLSGCGLQFMEVDAGIIEIVDRHVGIAAEPLVTSLLSDFSFAQSYFKAINLKKTDASSLGIVLLSVAVMKKLIHADSNTRKLWLNDEQNILESVFQIIDSLYVELSWPLQIPGVMSGGEPQRMVDLYQYLLTHLAGFVMSVSASEFPGVESMLLQNVLQTNAWKALLAIDLWCIVARYGSAELCFQHVCQLSSVLELMPPVESQPERMFLASLLNRLFPLLSSKHLAALPEVFPVPRRSNVWGVVPPALVPRGVAEQLQEHFVSCVDAWMKQPLSAEAHEAMVCSLSVVAGGTAQVPPDAGLVAKVIDLWHTVGNALSRQENVLAHWLHRLVFQLCDASAALFPHADNHQLLQMLSGMKILVAVGCSSVKFCVAKTLRKLCDKFFTSDADQAGVFRLIAELFSALLRDRNALVLETVLEAFEYFAHVTQHAEIVAASVKDDETCQRKVASYVQKILPRPEPTLALREYLQHQSQTEFVHRCCVSSANGRTTEMQPVKKFKAENCDEVKKVVQQYLDLSKQIVGYVQEERVSWDERVKLQKSASEILKCSNRKQCTA